MYAQPETSLHKQAMTSLTQVIGAIDKDRLSDHVGYVRSVVHKLTYDHKGTQLMATLPGLCQKGGLGPLLPMMQQGLMQGSPEIRESAAAGLGDLIELTSAKFLGPFVIKITGPLIRIVGDRFPPAVKREILHTLRLLINKSGMFLKAFLPQLQTTFMKALGDADDQVRAEGSSALADLMALSRRVDPVVVELAGSVKVPLAGSGVQLSQLQALAGILRRTKVAAKLAAATVTAVVDACMESIGEEEDGVRREAARVLGLGGGLLPPAEAAALTADLTEFADDWRTREGYCLALAGLFGTSKGVDDPDAAVDLVVTLAKERMEDDNAQV